jgi:1-acyl-sn-glycerol-3-phosphate acyltransferase
VIDLEQGPEEEGVRPISRAELALYAVCRFVAVGLTRALFPGRVVGAEHLPKSGPYILAPVHRSNLDWIIVARVTRRRLRYIVKDQVWRVRPLGRFIELLGAFPVHRESADRESMRKAIGVLAAGEPLVIFPEGTRRFGPTVGELREGTAYLALRAGVPILPVGIAGSDRALPKGRHVIRPTRVTLVIGEALQPPPSLSTAGADAPGGHSGRVPRSVNRALTEELRRALDQVLTDALNLEQLYRGQRLASPEATRADPTEVGGQSEPPDAAPQPE